MLAYEIAVFMDTASVYRTAMEANANGGVMFAIPNKYKE